MNMQGLYIIFANIKTEPGDALYLNAQNTIVMDFCSLLYVCYIICSNSERLQMWLPRSLQRYGDPSYS